MVAQIKSVSDDCRVCRNLSDVEVVLVLCGFVQFMTYVWFSPFIRWFSKFRRLSPIDLEIL
jgi:hypothetical protein